MSQEGNVAFICSCSHGHLEAAKYLLRRHRDSIDQDALMNSLKYACDGAQFHVVNHLLENYKDQINMEFENNVFFRLACTDGPKNRNHFRNYFKTNTPVYYISDKPLLSVNYTRGYHTLVKLLQSHYNQSKDEYYFCKDRLWYIVKPPDYEGMKGFKVKKNIHYSIFYEEDTHLEECERSYQEYYESYSRAKSAMSS